MAVAGTTSAAASTGQAQTAGATSGQTKTPNAATSRLLTNYDTFLQLLTTQLRVQNPMEPMDAEKFTEQLVQYSSVEQQIQTNQKLTSMLDALVSNAALNLVNYIGKNVEMRSDTTMLKDGKAAWQLTAAKDAPASKVTVRNAAGAVVFEGKTDLQKGANSYEWDGKGANGEQLPEGAYSITVAASDKDGAAVAVSTTVSGAVTAVETSGSEPYLVVNGKMVPLSGLMRIGS